MKKMTLALTAGFDQKKIIYPLLKLFKEIGIDSYAVLIGNKWETAARELLDRLKRATHIVIIPGASPNSSSWFPFLVGYCSGREHQGHFYIQGKPPFNESLCGVLETFRGTDEIHTFFTREKNLWEKNEREKTARHELVESGLGLTKENFAVCVIQGNREAANNYMALGFSPDTENERGVPLLILSIRNKHTDIALDLIAHGADVNRVSVDRGNTALMDAAVAGELPLVDALLDAGAEVNLQSKNGQTALMLAVGEGQAESVRELLDRGAEIRIKDNLGMTAMKYAELFKYPAIIKMLTETQKENENGPE